MHDQEFRDLRRELAAVARGPGRYYPDALRARVTRRARRQLDGGAALQDIASELGLRRYTLRLWTKAALPAATTALVPVEIIASTPRPGPVSVVSPSGFRIEGLTLDEAVAVIQRLR